MVREIGPVILDLRIAFLRRSCNRKLTDAAAGNVLDFSYCFNSNMSDADRAAHNCAASATLNNGNVAQIVNKQTTTRTQNFKYDSLNRIQSAYAESTTGQYCWDELFGYDPWSNLLTIGRISGWLAHWIEQIQDNRIYRPDQIYTGSHNEPYLPLEERV